MDGFLKFILVFIGVILMWIMSDTLSIASDVNAIRATITQHAK